jgi:hypothetical protein
MSGKIGSVRTVAVFDSRRLPKVYKWALFLLCVVANTFAVNKWLFKYINCILGREPVKHYSEKIPELKKLLYANIVYSQQCC